MKTKLTREEFKKIKELMDYALAASNKKEAQVYIEEIHSFGFDLEGNSHYLLSELESYIKEASGKVSDKAHWEDCARSSLYKLEWHGTESE